MVGLTQLSEKHYAYLQEQVKLGKMKEEEIQKLIQFLKTDKVLAFFPRYYGLCTLLPELFDDFNSIKFEYDLVDEESWYDKDWEYGQQSFKINNAIVDYISGIYVGKNIKSKLRIELTNITDGVCYYKLKVLGLNYEDFSKIVKTKDNFKLKNLKEITFYEYNEKENLLIPNYIDQVITKIEYEKERL